MYDEIWKFDDPIKNLKILLAENNVEEEIELIKTTREEISELKAELKWKQDLNMQEESETFGKFSDLYRKRRVVLDELYLKEVKTWRIRGQFRSIILVELGQSLLISKK